MPEQDPLANLAVLARGRLLGSRRKAAPTVEKSVWAMPREEKGLTTEDTEVLNNAPFSRLIPLRQKTTAGHGPALPEQDRFANRIFLCEVLRFWGTGMLRFRDILISLRSFFSETQYLGI